MAQRCDPPIPTHEIVESVIDGWDGAQKGMFQVLFETGWIDPDNKSKYRATAPKEWLDEEGKIKEEHKAFVLTHLISERKDFLNEVTALEWICNELSSDDCLMTVVFSPKYHCEIAGEGIEMCWGYLKKYYRRKYTVGDKKTKFAASVDGALKKLGDEKDIVRKYAGHVYLYMKAYKNLEAAGEKPSYEVVEKFKKRQTCHRSAEAQDSGVIEADVTATLKNE